MFSLNGNGLVILIHSQQFTIMQSINNGKKIS